MGGAQGQATDIEIYTKEMLRIKDTLFGIIATHTGKDIKQIRKDADRDNYMSAEEAIAYGLVDKILERSSDIKSTATDEKSSS
jgi:ATP-dependent Clp protease protease subunit